MSTINPQGYKFEKSPINSNPFWGGDGGSSNELWYPEVSEEGVISFSKQETDTPPTPRNIKGSKGDKGDTGKGITSITKVVTVGLVDTYQINYSDGTTGSFQVTNGAAGAQGAQGIGITSISKISTSGNVDTYQINYSNGTTSSFTVTNGTNGKSAYEIAVDDGYVGTETEWLISLHGADGESAYQVAVDNGYEGTEEEWLASLVGPQGEVGETPAITMTASVDNTVGTPAVTITKTGTDDAPNFDLAFAGLKGEDGKSAGFVQLPQAPTPFYNPSIDSDVKIELAIPFEVTMTDDTKETGNFFAYGILPAYGTANGRPVSAIRPSGGAIQTIFCLIEPANTFTYAKLPEALKKTQFVYLMFVSNANGQWELFRALINEDLAEVATQAGAGNVYYDNRAAFALVSGSNFQSNVPTDYSTGGLCLITLTVPDYRDQSISRYVEFRFTVPALPVPLTGGPHGDFKLSLSSFASWPAYGDDNGVTLNFEGELTLTEEIDSQTYDATGNYIIKEFTVNYFTVNNATSQIFTT